MALLHLFECNLVLPDIRNKHAVPVYNVVCLQVGAVIDSVYHEVPANG